MALVAPIAGHAQSPATQGPPAQEIRLSPAQMFELAEAARQRGEFALAEDALRALAGAPMSSCARRHAFASR